MRNNQSRPRPSQALFSGPKCRVAIPVHNILHRDALQQASLENSVRTIRYRQTPDLHGGQITLTGVILDKVEGDFLLMVCEARPERSQQEFHRLSELLAFNGLRLLERDASDIRREPRFSNVRTVWSHEHHHVGLNDRLRIAAALVEEGPQSVFELEKRARPSCDILAAVCSLACEDLLELNIDYTPLGCRTMVRSR
jgi:hypothetical protein